MGRPSLAPVRRGQILDAVEACILGHGLSGTTLARIAEAAEVQPSLIAHYFGSKDAVIAAAVERTLQRFRGGFEDAVRGIAPARQLDALLGVLFSGRMTAREYSLMVDVLIAESYWSEATRAGVRSLYQRFAEMLRAAVDAAYPRASAERRAQVAYGLLCLADANNTFACIGFDPAHHAQARAMADVLVATLGPGVRRRAPGGRGAATAPAPRRRRPRSGRRRRSRPPG
jgi:AcrR family transcriptional regulator